MAEDGCFAFSKLGGVLPSTIRAVTTCNLERIKPTSVEFASTFGLIVHRWSVAFAVTRPLFSFISDILRLWHTTCYPQMSLIKM